MAGEEVVITLSDDEETEIEAGSKNAKIEEPVITIDEDQECIELHDDMKNKYDFMRNIIPSEESNTRAPEIVKNKSIALPNISCSTKASVLIKKEATDTDENIVNCDAHKPTTSANFANKATNTIIKQEKTTLDTPNEVQIKSLKNNTQISSSKEDTNKETRIKQETEGNKIITKSACSHLAAVKNSKEKTQYEQLKNMHHTSVSISKVKESESKEQGRLGETGIYSCNKENDMNILSSAINVPCSKESSSDRYIMFLKSITDLAGSAATSIKIEPPGHENSEREESSRLLQLESLNYLGEKWSHKGDFSFGKCAFHYSEDCNFSNQPFPPSMEELLMHLSFDSSIDSPDVISHARILTEHFSKRRENICLPSIMHLPNNIPPPKKPLYQEEFEVLPSEESTNLHESSEVVDDFSSEELPPPLLSPMLKMEGILLQEENENQFITDANISCEEQSLLETEASATMDNENSSYSLSEDANTPCAEDQIPFIETTDIDEDCRVQRQDEKNECIQTEKKVNPEQLDCRIEDMNYESLNAIDVKIEILKNIVNSINKCGVSTEEPVITNMGTINSPSHFETDSPLSPPPENNHQDYATSNNNTVLEATTKYMNFQHELDEEIDNLIEENPLQCIGSPHFSSGSPVTIENVSTISKSLQHNKCVLLETNKNTLNKNGNKEMNMQEQQIDTYEFTCKRPNETQTEEESNPKRFKESRVVNECSVNIDSAASQLPCGEENILEVNASATSIAKEFNNEQSAKENNLISKGDAPVRQEELTYRDTVLTKELQPTQSYPSLPVVPGNGHLTEMHNSPTSQNAISRDVWHGNSSENYTANANASPLPALPPNCYNSYLYTPATYVQSPVGLFGYSNWNFPLSVSYNNLTYSRALSNTSICQPLYGLLNSNMITQLPPLPREKPPPPPPLPPSPLDTTLNSPSSLHSSPQVSHASQFHPSTDHTSAVQRVCNANTIKSATLLPQALTSRIGTKLMSPTEVVTVILSWNVQWLHDIVGTNTPPPFIHGPIRSAGFTYESHEQYYNTYFPLLLIETWERIFCGWKAVKQHQQLGFSSKVEHLQEDGDVMKIDCSIHVNCGERYPSDGDIVLLEFDSMDENSFGYVTSHEHIDVQCGMENVQKHHLCVKIMQSEGSKMGKVKIYSLYNIKIPLTQVKALRDIGVSPFFRSVLHPNGTVCDRVVLGRYRASSYTISQAVIQIMSSILLHDPNPRITVIDPVFGTDQLTVLVALIEYVKKLKINGLHSKILVCVRSINRLNEIGARLLPTAEGSDEIKTVILAKVKDVKKELAILTLDHMISTQLKNRGNLHKLKAHKDYTTMQDTLLETCDVLLSFITTCHNSNTDRVLGFKSKQPLSICIIDESYMTTEPETLVPLLYGIKKVVLFGDPTVKPKTWTDLARANGYKMSLASRILKCLKK